MTTIVHYIPLLTTVLSAVFFWVMLAHYRQKPDKMYLLWWTAGVFCYGLGTLVESLVTLTGWSEGLFRAWYIAGALLGGAPLAQGTAHLLLKPAVANRLSWILLAVISAMAVPVLLSPIQTEAVEAHRLSGAVLEWQWIRLGTPLINLYAFVLLVGGALYSAWRYAKEPSQRVRFVGNLAIALGGLLPGIGGSFTKFGYTEVLYVTELIGLCLIWAGYRVMRRDGEGKRSVVAEGGN